MATISDAAIAQAAAGSGFPAKEIPTAVAVALAESGGNPVAVNDREPDGSTSRGLWQINSVHKGLLASGDWRNPADNARMAFNVWKGQGWQGWGAYNNGSYLLFMARGRAASGSAGSGTVVPVASSGGYVDAITNPHTWLRIGTVVLGALLIGILVIRAIGTDTITDAVGTAIPVGRAAKLAGKVLK